MEEEEEEGEEEEEEEDEEGEEDEEEEGRGRRGIRGRRGGRGIMIRSRRHESDSSREGRARWATTALEPSLNHCRF